MRLIPLLSLAALLLAAGCAKDDTVVAVNYDGDPIDDLVATVTSPTTLTLNWSAPSAGGAIAAGYRVRWRVGDLDAATWDDANTAADPPEPLAPGDPQEQWLLDLPAGTDVAVAVRYTQGAGISDLSNVVVVTMPPTPEVPEGCFYVPAGTFLMGSPDGELGRNADNEVRHQVTLTRGFFLGRHEVTQAEYAAVIGDDPSYHVGSARPVEQVSFLDAVAYCNARSQADGLAMAYVISGEDVTWNQEADGWRLPTDAEWEYACRAGSQDALAGGALTAISCNLDYFLSQFGLYCGNDLDGDDEDGGTTAVGQYRHNAWGLYDMHGNVWEWCWDWYVADLGTTTAVDPVGPDLGSVRVLRGGAWNSQAQSCRSASRSYLTPTLANRAVGFRVARTAAW